MRVCVCVCVFVRVWLFATGMPPVGMGPPHHYHPQNLMPPPPFMGPPGAPGASGKRGTFIIYYDCIGYLSDFFFFVFACGVFCCCCGLDLLFFVLVREQFRFSFPYVFWSVMSDSVLVWLDYLLHTHAFTHARVHTNTCTRTTAAGSLGDIQREQEQAKQDEQRRAEWQWQVSTRYQK